MTAFVSRALVATAVGGALDAANEIFYMIVPKAKAGLVIGRGRFRTKTKSIRET